MSFSKNKIRYIRSLKDKKNRIEHRTFVVEGNKMVKDLIPVMKCQLLIGTEAYLQTFESPEAEEIIVASEEDICRASFLKNPQQAIAVFYQPDHKLEESAFTDQLSLVLDGIQDPGNFGTIIRLADWYGIENVFCSKDTVDIYNPKTTQATMGALARVKVYYLDLEAFILQYKDKIPVYGTVLDGKNMYGESLSSEGFLIMGNEGNGIRPEIEKLLTHKLFIPSYPPGHMTSESLNVAVATAIVCAEFRRRVIEK